MKGFQQGPQEGVGVRLLERALLFRRGRGKRLKFLDLLIAAGVIGESADLRCCQKLFFVSSAIQSPCFMKIDTVKLTERFVLQYALTMKTSKLRNEKGERPHRNGEHDQGQRDCIDFEVH